MPTGPSLPLASAARLLGLGAVALCLLLGVALTGRSETGPASTIRLGNQGLVPFKLDGAKGPGQGSRTIDARNARFVVSNSRNPHPVEGSDCSQGTGAINLYPLRIYDAGRTVVEGGLFAGTVPQTADWEATYCNSAAVLWKDSPGGVMRNQRIDSVWDAIRIGQNSGGLSVRGAWISNVRDDAIENDYLQPAEISDSLIDGALHALSVKPSKKTDIGRSGGAVRISDTLILLKASPYKGRLFFGALAKADERAPELVVDRSLIAIQPGGGRTWPNYWRLSWAKTRATDSKLLWLSGEPLPEALGNPPAGIEIVTGKRAHDLWAAAKANWIACHTAVPRLASDPPASSRACRR